MALQGCSKLYIRPIAGIILGFNELQHYNVALIDIL